MDGPQWMAMGWHGAVQNRAASPCIQLSREPAPPNPHQGRCAPRTFGRQASAYQRDLNGTGPRRFKDIWRFLRLPRIVSILPLWSSWLWQIDFSQSYKHSPDLQPATVVFCILLRCHGRRPVTAGCSLVLSFWAALSCILFLTSLASWVLQPAFSFCNHATHMGGLGLTLHTTTLRIQKPILSAKLTVRTIQSKLFLVANWKEATSCKRWWSSWFLISIRRTLLNQLAMQLLTSSLRHPSLRGLPVEYVSAIRWRHQWHQKHTEPFTGFAQQRRHDNILFRVNITESEQTLCWSAKRSCMCVCVILALDMTVMHWWHAGMLTCDFCFIVRSNGLKGSMPHAYSAKECHKNTY